MREIRFLRLWIAVQIFCNSGWIDVDPVRMFHVNNFSNGSLIFEWENLFVFAIYASEKWLQDLRRTRFSLGSTTSLFSLTLSLANAAIPSRCSLMNSSPRRSPPSRAMAVLFPANVSWFVSHFPDWNFQNASSPDALRWLFRYFVPKRRRKNKMK